MVLQQSKPVLFHKTPPRPSALVKLSLYLFSLVLFFHLGCSTPLPQGARCKSSDECEKGLKCLGGFCGAGNSGARCLNNYDCLPSLRCIKLFCRIPRPDEEPEVIDSEFSENLEEARSEQSFDAFEQIEEPVIELPPVTEDGSLCRSQSDCPRGQLCMIGKDGLSAVCVYKPGTCSSTEDCKKLKPGTYCRAVTDQYDKTGLYCVYPFQREGKLKSPGELCRHSEECTSQICLKESGLCGAFCESDDHCPKQFYCGTYSFFLKGEFKGCRPFCQSDSDCPEGFQCNSSRKCHVAFPENVGGPCRKQEHCMKDGLCVDGWHGGYCTWACSGTNKLCQSDQPCPSGESCTYNPFTKKSYCTKSCQGNGICAFFDKANAYCLKRCQSGKNCRKKYYCAGLEGHKGTVCLPRGDKRLGHSCENNSDCESGICHSFAGGRYCSQPCETTACPAGYSCRDTKLSFPKKLCERDCTKDEECPTSYRCLSQRCELPKNTKQQDLGMACLVDDHCKSSFCVKGTLFPHGYCSIKCVPGKEVECTSDAVCDKDLACLGVPGVENKKTCQCPTGSLCIPQEGGKGYCLRTCKDDDGCGRGQYFCHDIKLQNDKGQTISCSSKSPCQGQVNFPLFCKDSVEGSFCSTGLCLGRGPRAAGLPCQNGLDCHSGFCYKAFVQIGPACKSRSDCNPTYPICEKKSGRCVQCEKDTDCRYGSCEGHICSVGGYCAASCKDSSNCPQGTQCATMRNHLNQSIGRYCLPQCRSDLQCLAGFSCQEIKQSRGYCHLK